MPNELILVVEDVELMREILRETLLQEGFQVFTAGDGQEALDCMQGLQPDLIISDITMPGMDGLEFYQEVRKRAEWVSIPFIFLTARTDPADLLVGRNLGVDDYLTKPIYRAELVTTIRSRLRRYHQTQVARLQQAYLESLITLANAIEQRSPGGHAHIQRVTELSLLLGRRMGWPSHRLDMLQFAAVLHDIGKIHLPASLLLKEGPLDAAEWEMVRRHPITGAEMIKRVRFVAECAPYVRHHHERWDGRGYPDGLSGEDIPDGARILCLADSLISMCWDRPYAPSRTLDEAIGEIQSLGGQIYDPGMVNLLKTLYENGELKLSTPW
jgi:putative two-component system response regulator